MKRLLAASLLALTTASHVHAQEQIQPSPAPGVLVDVGGYDQHLYCTGKGGPTVVLDAGLGDWSLQFRPLQERIAEFTRVCSVDRAGYGWSDHGMEPRTSQQITSEMARLLDGAGEEGPYVLVGHSFGGLNTILFANQNADRVAGVVLIDASHPEQTARLASIPEMTAMEAREMEMFRGMVVAASNGRLPASAMLPHAPAVLPEHLRETWAEQFVRPTSLGAGIAEYDALEQSALHVGQHGSLGNTPLIVIAHGLHLGDVMPADIREQSGLSLEILERYEAIWRELQEDHLSRSSDSRLIVAENSTHYVHHIEPDLVVEAVRDLVMRSDAGAF